MSCRSGNRAFNRLASLLKGQGHHVQVHRPLAILKLILLFFKVIIQKKYNKFWNTAVSSTSRSSSCSRWHFPASCAATRTAGAGAAGRAAARLARCLSRLLPSSLHTWLRHILPLLPSNIVVHHDCSPFLFSALYRSDGYSFWAFLTTQLLSFLHKDQENNIMHCLKIVSASSRSEERPFVRS